MPEQKNRYDWTFSFEPIGSKRGLPVAVLRSLLNKKGCKLVIFPRYKKGEPVGKKTEAFPKILETFNKIYGVETKAEDVFIEAEKIGGKKITTKHRMFTIFTNEKAKEMAEKDLDVLFNGVVPDEVVFRRLEAIGQLLKKEYLSEIS